MSENKRNSFWKNLQLPDPRGSSRHGVCRDLTYATVEKDFCQPQTAFLNLTRIKEQNQKQSWISLAAPLRIGAGLQVHSALYASFQALGTTSQIKAN